MGSTGRIVIDDVSPCSVHGYAAKAIVAEPFEATATIFRDGNGIGRARLRWRLRETVEWSSVSMDRRGDDRFHGSFVPDAVGAHEFVIEAWTSRFDTWRRDLRAKFGADEPIESELLEGALLLDDFVPSLDAQAARRVADAATTLRSTTCALSVRLDAGLDDAVAEVLRDVVDADDLTQSTVVPIAVEPTVARVGSWYEFFPRSEGGFANGAADRLDAVAAMRFDVVYLPPIHPIGRTNRKGRGNSLTAGPDDPGSPWAIGAAEGGHTAMHPDLGSFDDFDRFVRRADELDLRIALDYALQCSPDHPWVRDHPEWFHRLPDGSIRYAENPPKKYEDIHPINFWPAEEHRMPLWEACRDVLTFWIDRGVSIFRVDNPHTKPVAFWEWLIPEIRSEHPEVVLLAEAFTVPTMMYKLGAVGFSQGYTYFTWRDDAADMREYVEELSRGPHASWFRPNFWPNTPDILGGPLREGSPAAFRMRAVLAALLSPSWGIYSGFELCENRPQSPDNEEYHDSEKYRVMSRDWSDPDSLAPFITRLNEIRRQFVEGIPLSTVTFHETDHPSLLAWSYRQDEQRLLVVVNFDLDEPSEGTIRIDLEALGLDGGADFEVTDQLTAEAWTWRGADNYVRLDPTERVAHVFSI
jgi:starch synthase (maltosyl-transferring)